ncbi:restriction endonuclease subunit S [Winogradskyella forsetii]|uniref:restriction endonuclease subunit S n=1 Tax=Winogradskyella forsetii TaxID=2686077 RepID=UPI0015C10316|nr:restriction endonuclease subunit S [Winogradskyella forsetii]
MSKTIQINEIAILNKETYKKSEIPKTLYYLDTGSLTKNKIESLQEFNTSKDKVPSRAQRKVQINTILYSTVRPNQEHYGIIENEIEDVAVSTGFTTIDVDNENVYPKYLYYMLTQNHLTEYLHSIAQNSVSSYPSISSNDLGSLTFDIPEIEIQKQIAKVLSNIDAKIEVNNKINQELEAMVKTLYDYWFVQFDFPDANGKPYKSSGGKMVFNEELKREIPEGWEVDALSTWIKNDKSGDWGKAEEQGNYINKVSCIRGADLNGLNGKGVVKSPTRFVLEKNSHKLLEIGDFIIEISGGSPTQSTGRMAFITKETLERFENPLICSNFCKAVTLKDEKALYNFAYLWNRLYDADVLFGWEGKTSGIKNLLFESFVTNYQVANPDSIIMEQFYNKAKPIHSQIQTNLKQNQKLSELRDWLLPMLMNGQVRVAHSHTEGNLAKVKQSYKVNTKTDLGRVAEEGETYN